MQVVKRNGTSEPANLNKILASLTKVCAGLDIDPAKIATKVIGGLFDGATTMQIDELTIDKGIWLINENPEYSTAMARVLMGVIHKEVNNQEIQSFSQCIAAGNSVGLISDEVNEYVRKNARKLNAAIHGEERDNKFEYFGLKTVYDRYLLRHPITRQVIETPQFWLMRVACGIFTNDIKNTIEFYNVLSSHEFMSSTPTLFNSGTKHTQMSSCYLLDSPLDDLGEIYDQLKRVALLSKFAGGIGIDYTSIRAADSLIRGTNGLSNGIIPFIHLQDASVIAVNQGGKRKGAAAIYLEVWHADIMAFLELRDSTGDPHRRAHNLNLANWIPDEFMRRVRAKEDWTLLSPDDPEVAALTRMHGDAFAEAYKAVEAKYVAMEVKPLWYKVVPATVLWHRVCKTLAETGNGWVNFKDTANGACMQVTPTNGRIVRSSNLCTEILETVDQDNVAVCNLGSIVLSAVVTPERKIDWVALARIVKLGMTALNQVIDKNFYPVEEAANSNMDWRPVGLGVMGTQDFLHKMGLHFDDEAGVDAIEEIHAFIYYHALKTSCEIAKKDGPFPQYENSRYAMGDLHIDLYDNGRPLVSPGGIDWDALRKDIKKYGVRNSLCIAIAPTATIAGIVGVGECIEPTFSNLFTRTTLSGEFMQVNAALTNDLRKLNLWNDDVRAQIIAGEGSVQHIDCLPDWIKRKFRTVWEYSMHVLMRLANVRGRYIDQSQSLNLYMANATIGKVSSMYMAAWEKYNAKTTYYLRTRAASSNEKVNVKMVAKAVDVPAKEYTDEEVIVCSLDNPGACEACQ